MVAVLFASKQSLIKDFKKNVLYQIKKFFLIVQVSFETLLLGYFVEVCLKINIKRLQY